MKQLFLVLFSAFLTFGAFAQETPTAVAAKDGQTGPKIEFAAMTVEYGVIEKNGDPYRTVAFKNVGDAPLIIKSAKGNCGCTVPTVPKEPILPGESSELKVRYATNRVGKINKTVTITTNETGTNRHVLRVKGEVLKPETIESVPKSTEGFFKKDEKKKTK